MRNTGYIVIIVVLFGLIGYYAYSTVDESPSLPVALSGIRSVSIPLLAVDDNNNGLVIPITVELSPGTGKVLVDIENPSFILDTQDSMRLAVAEAAQMTNTDMSNYDVVFSVTTNISLIGGPSAGAAMTLATMALLLDKQIDPDVAVTGTIEEGGYIGPVGGIKEKAEAAKNYGITLFVVPVGEAISKEPTETCNKKTGNGWSQKECYITYNTVNISQETGLTVVEAGTISDAMKYILV